MRIVLLTSSLGAGGAERVATTLCNAWADRGDKVLLMPTYSGGGTPFYEVAKNVELMYLADRTGASNTPFWGYLKRLLALRRTVISWKPDVIISFLPNVNVATILGTAFLDIPIIVCERSDPTSRPAPFFWGCATKILYRYADMLTVQTSAVANKVIKLYPGVPRIRTVPNPLPAGVLLRARTPVVGRRKLLSLGRLSNEKQVNKIIEAFAETAGEFEDWDLHICGEGPQRPVLEKLIAERQLCSRINIPGQTYTPWDVMAAADVFVMTSQYEGFPNALLEAMGIGLPCIAFDCPSGPREISDDGKAALLVPLNDQSGLVAAMRHVMTSGALRNELGHKARASVIGRFSLDAVICRWDELFREVGAISDGLAPECDRSSDPNKEKYLQSQEKKSDG